MVLALGIDVGWSARRRSCALAIRGHVVISRPKMFAAEVSVGLFKIDELLAELARLAHTHAELLRGAILVIDGPIGPNIDAIPHRGVDGSFASNGFFNRAPGYRITQGSGLELSKATARILHTLATVIPIRPWLGGPLPTDGLVVAETNPTPAMALLLPQQGIRSLPSRAHAKYVDGTPIRAKSDWYWRLGAGSYAAEVLGDPGIATEKNHERVAGLFALSLAVALGEGSTVSLGDSAGTYVVPSQIDETWAADVRRVGTVHGSPHFIRSATPVVPEALPLDVAGVPENAELETDVGSDLVAVVLNDNGGLNTVANPWLDEVDVPCGMSGPRNLAFTVEATFRGKSEQYRISPSALTLARELGFDGAHLSEAAPIAFEATIEQPFSVTSSDHTG